MAMAVTMLVTVVTTVSGHDRLAEIPGIAMTPRNIRGNHHVTMEKYIIVVMTT